MTEKKKGSLTFKSAGVLFFLSAIPEIFSLTMDVPLLGRIIGGGGAAAYHLVYFFLYLSLGIGLWGARQWGYKLVFIATAVYTLDKALLLLYRESAVKWIVQQLNRYGGAGQMLDPGTMSRAILMMTVTVVVCWWGFALYTYLRRDYFAPG